ncbi:hypothetical protein BOX15_Mlig018142g1 [Macrostomum lignano]|uniref:Uncharacterized protein n=1 Tax=Macrostomum lignano TaxID=282301 RepID=A0A267E4U8_9PLAT|nr:hypothetical protein BOX15_Mlig018142g1 [Macrostomum lignano]
MSSQQQVTKTCLSCHNSHIAAWAKFCGKCPCTDEFPIECQVCGGGAKIKACQHSPFESWRKVCSAADCNEQIKIDDKYCCVCGARCNFCVDLPVSSSAVCTSLPASASGDGFSSHAHSIASKRSLDSTDSSQSPEKIEESTIKKLRAEDEVNRADSRIDPTIPRSLEQSADVSIVVGSSQLSESLEGFFENQSARSDAEMNQAAPSDAEKKQAAPSDAEKNQAVPSDAEKNQAAPSDAEKNRAAPSDAEKNRAAPSDAEKNQAAPSDAEKNRAAPSDAEKNQAAPSDAEKNRAVPSDAEMNQAALSDAEKNQAVPSDAEMNQAAMSDAEKNQAALSDAEKNQAVPSDAEMNQAAMSDAEKNQAAPSDSEKNQAAPSDAEINQAVPSDSEKNRAAPSDSEKNQAAPSDSEKNQAAPSDSEKNQAALSDAEKNQAAPSDAEKNQAAPSDSEKNQAAPSDAEKNQAALSDAEKNQAAPGDAEKNQAAPGDAEKNQAAPSDAEKNQATLSDAEKKQAAPSDAEKNQAVPSDAEKNQAALSDAEKNQAVPSDAEKNQAALSDAQKNQVAPSDTEKNDGGNEQSTEPKETLTNDNHSDSGKSDSRKRSSKSGADDSQLASKSDNGSSPASPKRSRSATRCSAAPTIPDNERSRGQGTDLSQDQRSFADVARGTGQRQPQQLSYEEHVNKLTSNSADLIPIRFVFIVWYNDLQVGQLALEYFLPESYHSGIVTNFTLEPIDNSKALLHTEILLPRELVLNGRVTYRYWLMGSRMATRQNGSDTPEQLPASLCNSGWRRIFSLQTDSIVQMDGHVLFFQTSEFRQTFYENMMTTSVFMCFRFYFSQLPSTQQRLDAFNCLLKSADLYFSIQPGPKYLILIEAVRYLLQRYHPINQDQSPEQQWQQWTKNLELLHFATVAKAAPFFHGPYSFKFEDISALLDRILPPETPCDSMLSGLAQLPKDLPESAKAWYSGMISSDREFKPEYLLLLPAYHILQYGEELHSSDRIPLRQAFLDLLKSRGSASLFDWCGLTKEFDRLMKNCGPRMNNSVELVKQRLMRYRRVDPLIPRCYAAFMDLRLFDTDLEPSDWLPASNKLALIGYNLAQPPPGTIKFGFEASLPDKHSAFCNFYNTLTAQLQSGAFPQPELELCLELHCQTFKIFCSCVSDKGRNPLSKHSKRPADTISCLLAAVNLTIVLCSATSDGVEAAGGASGVPVVEQLSLLEKQVFRSEDKGDPRTIELLSQVFATLQDCKPSLAKPCYSALDSFVSCLLFKTDLDGVIALMEGKKLQNERLKESVSSVAVDKITHESSSKGNLLSRLFSRLFSSSNEPLRKIGRILLAQFNLEEPGPNAVLKFSLTWKLCAQITCHEDYKKLKSKMEPEFASLLKRCLSAVRQTLKELCQGRRQRRWTPPSC